MSSVLFCVGEEGEEEAAGVACAEDTQTFSFTCFLSGFIFYSKLFKLGASMLTRLSGNFGHFQQELGHFRTIIEVTSLGAAFCNCFWAQRLHIWECFA